MNDLEICDRVVERLRKLRVQESSVVLQRRRSTQCQIRSGQVEKLQESRSTVLTAHLYVDGRYGAHTSNDLRDASLDAFLKRAIASTKLLDPDPFRRLPEPEFFEQRPGDDLGLVDPQHEALTTAQRKELALATAAQCTAPGVIAPTGELYDDLEEIALVTSNGCRAQDRGSSFSIGGDLTLPDGERRASDSSHRSGRRWAELSPKVGAEALERTRARIGAKRVAGGTFDVLVENRAAGRLLFYLLAAAGGAALQQRRSFLLNKKGQPIGSPQLTLLDDPLIPAGLGSQHFDGEGMSARRRSIVRAGVLENYFIDSYYARKLTAAPTTRSPSNLVVAPGKDGLAALESQIQRGLVVTSFIGGNSNAATGDFSVGLMGHLIEKGRRVQPIAEMNLSGNHTTFWMKLAAVGNDPWTSSSVRTPSLLFAGAAVSGA